MCSTLRTRVRMILNNTRACAHKSEHRITIAAMWCCSTLLACRWVFFMIQTSVAVFAALIVLVGIDSSKIDHEAARGQGTKGWSWNGRTAIYTLRINTPVLGASMRQYFFGRFLRKQSCCVIISCVLWTIEPAIKDGLQGAMSYREVFTKLGVVMLLSAVVAFHTGNAAMLPMIGDKIDELAESNSTQFGLPYLGEVTNYQIIVVRITWEMDFSV